MYYTIAKRLSDRTDSWLCISSNLPCIGHLAIEIQQGHQGYRIDSSGLDNDRDGLIIFHARTLVKMGGGLV